MAAWLVFVGFTVVLAVVAVALARQSARYVQSGIVPAQPVLYANVIGTQTVIVVLLGAAVWLAGIPSIAFGPVVDGRVAILGAGTGVLVFGGSVLVTRALSRVGLTYSEALRDALEPRTTWERVVLYVGALPSVAVGEELLFRGALIGGVATGVDISPWFPAIGSSALFGYAHSAQGRAGMVVTGVLGFLLAGVFIVTDSLLAAVVAHYVVNALEFAIGPRLTER